MYGLLGNHDVMMRDSRGERNFNKRFPDHKRTGYLEIIDSMAIVLLNTNFSKLSVNEIDQQQKWYPQNNRFTEQSSWYQSDYCYISPSDLYQQQYGKTFHGSRQQFLPAFLASKKCVLFVTVMRMRLNI